MRTCLQGVQNGDRSSRVVGGRNKADCSLNFEVKLRSQRRVDNDNLATCIHHEVEWTSIVDLYRNYNQRSPNYSRGYTCDISRTMSFCRSSRDERCGKNDGSETIQN